MALVISSMTAARADTNFDRNDLKVRPPTSIITQRPPKCLSNQIFWLRRGTQAPFVAPASPVPGIFTKSFFLSDVYNATELAKVFDQYCIYAVICTFNCGQSTITAGNLGTITTVIDFSDISPLSSQSEAKAYSTAITEALSQGKGVTRYIEPCLSQSVYQATLTFGFGPARSWIDINSPSIPHFGLKAIVTDNVASMALNLSTEYVIGFRSSK